MSRGLAQAFALFTGASAIGSLTQVIKGKFTTLLLGTDGVGILNQLTNLWSLFSVLAGLGFFNGLLRHLAPAWENGDREGFHRHMSSCALLMMISACSLALLGCLAAPWLSGFLFSGNSDYSDLICLILLSIPIFVAGQIYRAMLNATRSTLAAVRVRIAADVLSVLALIGLLYAFGLKGAVMGYISLHILYLIFSLYFVCRVLGTDMALPNPARFSRHEIQRNLGFGINGLIAVATGIITTLIVSRWIIASSGATGNGLYVMALSVTTVYMGGLSAAAGGYYFPTLSAAKNQSEMFEIMNQTWSMYLRILPPIIVLLMAMGEWLMLVLFTKDFTPAAALLLYLLPGDLCRVSAETLGMALLAKKRLILSTGSYLIWSALYLGLAYVLLPLYGLRGVALAYLLSQVYNGLHHLALSRIILGYRPDWIALFALLRGLSVVGVSVLIIISDLVPHYKVGVIAVALGGWFALSCFDPEFKAGLYKLAHKIGLARFI